MSAIKLHKVKTITEYHRLLGLPKPEHPLISVVDIGKVTLPPYEGPFSVLFDFYMISIKRSSNVKYKYGQQQYDFDEGVMFFTAPNQLFGLQSDPKEAVENGGWILLVHQDFLWNTPLARTIRQYEFFDYSVNEALFLSEREEKMIDNIVDNIRQEYHANTDRFSQDIMIAHLETLLSYAQRFYHRQFLTRKIANHQVLARLETLLAAYFNGDGPLHQGLPSVTYVAEQLTMSATYLSTLLKVLTGLNTQQHIHDKVIAVAKEKLVATDLSVSEIAYSLGFEHTQSFSRLFKSKTNLSPIGYRQSFN